MPLQAARLSEIWQPTLTWQPDLPRFTTRCCKALKHFVLLPRFVSHLKEKLCLKTTSTYRMTFRIWEPNFTDIQPIPISYTSSLQFLNLLFFPFTLLLTEGFPETSPASPSISTVTNNFIFKCCLWKSKLWNRRKAFKWTLFIYKCLMLIFQ